MAELEPTDPPFHAAAYDGRADALLTRLAAFFVAPQADAFDELALAAFAFQLEHCAPLRELCERRHVKIGDIARWEDVPLVPVTAFRTLGLTTAPPREIFRSSGTHGPDRSVHGHPYPDLYRAAVDASFPAFCLPRGDRPPMLSLVPPRSVAADSSLGFMVEHVLARFGGPGSLYAFGARGIEAATARSWLGGRQRSGAPAFVLATELALVDLLETLDRMGLRFRLAPGSAVFVTGGAKGRRRELAPGELAVALSSGLGLGAEAVVGEYGMTELTSQAYTRTLLGGRDGLFFPPPWMRFRVLSPDDLSQLPPGEPGVLAFFDLANVGSALHLLTEDLGVAEAGGFRLLGRAADSGLRGCSLLAEELSHPDP